MKLFNKISPKASSIILLFSFLGIYIINIGCSIGNVVEDLKWFSQTEEHSDDHHGNHHHKHDNKKSKEQKDDGCCDDEATIFFASVQVFPSHQVNFGFSPDELSILNFSLVDIFDSNFYSDIIIDNRPPPDTFPRFPDTRIFIQSFQV